MNRNVLIISPVETFMIKGLEMKLKGKEVNTLYCPPKIKELKKSCEDSDLIIVYLDEAANDYSEAFVYLKDHCIEKDKKTVVIGSEDEISILRQYLPSSCILSVFERPLEMDRLIDTVENYLSEESALSRRKSILIVDDDVSYMTTILEWLRDTYRVHMANSGMQAITWLATNNADLILLDYEMPVTDGPKVLEMLKSDPRTEDIPVIFLTGKGDKKSILRVLSLKPAGYLLKAIDKRELNEKVSEFFMKRAAAGQEDR